MTPMPFDENGYGQPEPTATDLGLPTLAPAYTAPDWFLDDAPVVMDGPRYLCCEYAFEWHMAAGPDEAALLEQARELATQTVLREELDRRELAARNEAQAAELARLRELRADAADRLVAQLNEAQKDADHWTEKFYALEEETHAALTKAGAPIFAKDGIRLSIPQRIEALKPNTGPQRQKTTATTPPEPVRDKEAAVLSLAYLRAYLRITDAGEVQQRAYDLLCDLGRPWHQRKRFGHVVTRVQEAGIKVGLTPQEASQPLQVIQGQGGIQRKPAS